MRHFLLLIALAAHVFAISLPALDLRQPPEADASDPQKSLTLSNKVIAKGFENDGQSVPEPGQTASLTSSNNYINFCLTRPDLPITNGKQIAGGSCSTVPMGLIPSSDNIPSAKFLFPTNFEKIKANHPFTVKLNIKNLETGHFTNAQQTYYSAPQQLNPGGLIIGHSHVVIEALDSLQQTDPTDPLKFVFFKGLNDPAQDGVLTADVTAGLPKGTYRISTINSAANHQSVAAPIAQRGAIEDAVYFVAT